MAAILLGSQQLFEPNLFNTNPIKVPGWQADFSIQQIHQLHPEKYASLNTVSAKHGRNHSLFLKRHVWSKANKKFSISYSDQLRSDFANDEETFVELLDKKSDLQRHNDGATVPDSIYVNNLIVGGKAPSWYEKGNLKSDRIFEGGEGEPDWAGWADLDADLNHWTSSLRPVQWYPGHIAKTERELKEQLKLIDVVIEVRDARIPLSTTHPEMEAWLGNRKRILVLNREDMISNADRNFWAAYYSRQGIKVILSNGKHGMGAMKLTRLAKALAIDVNIKRKSKGLLPRAVRAGIVGYPNVGKSSIINRLLKRRLCAAAPRPGVTRELRWVHFGKDLELLDSPGIIPMRISDQAAAIKLAICDDIGERSYNVGDVAAILVQMLTRLPSAGTKAFYNRYKIDIEGRCGKTFVETLANQLFNGDVNQASFRILSDFRKGKFGWTALERPPM